MSSLLELRQIVKKVTGNTNKTPDINIKLCMKRHFRNCDFIPLASGLLETGIACGYPWKIVRWKFTNKREDKSVLYIRYKNSYIINVYDNETNILLMQRKMFFQRRFTWENSQLVAHHDYLVLPEKLQNNDMSKIINSLMYDFYKKINIKIVKVYAGFEAGGYVWATAGFYATRKHEVYAILDLNRKRVASGKAEELSLALIDEFQEIADEHYKDKHGDFDMYSWAMKRPGGKELLVGTDWHGELKLENPEQRIIFEDYLNRRKKL